MTNLSKFQMIGILGSLVGVFALTRCSPLGPSVDKAQLLAERNLRRSAPADQRSNMPNESSLNYAWERGKSGFAKTKLESSEKSTSFTLTEDNEFSSQFKEFKDKGMTRIELPIGKRSKGEIHFQIAASPKDVDTYELSKFLPVLYYKNGQWNLSIAESVKPEVSKRVLDGLTGITLIFWPSDPAPMSAIPRPQPTFPAIDPAE